MILLIQITGTRDRTENLIKANKMYCQLYKTNYEVVRPDMRSTSETSLKQVLGSYQAYLNNGAELPNYVLFDKRYPKLL